MEVAGVVGEVAGLFEGFLPEDPVLVAAGFPFGEVLFADGVALEAFGEDLPGFGLTVEPGDEFDALFAAVEAAVELVAEGAGEAGDFTVAGFSHRFLVVGG